ncbi:MAG: restriction endonuclease subunit S [Clostridiales bacterium]|nr:restriction endonuclease subunit S [Clostridiales bacterium]
MRAKFSDVFEDVTRKGRKLPTSQYNETGKYPIFDQGQNVIAGYTDEEEGLYVDVPAYIFGDHTRVIKYVDTPCFLGADGVKLLKAKDKMLNPRFLYYALLSVKIPNTGYNRHFKWLKESTINIADADTQQNIVKILDKIEQLTSIHQQQLATLDELVKARFVEMFGDPVSNPLAWPIESLENHLDIIGGCAFKSDGFIDNGIPVLRIGNINSGKFLAVNMVYWSDDSALDRYKVYPGDLVISLTGTVGKNDYGNVCILGIDFPVYYLNQRNAKLSLKDTLHRTYLAQLLKFAPIKQRLTGISRGVRQANIANRDILQLCVPIPPLEEQEQFATFVTQTDQTKSTIQASLEELETLKKSLMQEYFG